MSAKRAAATSANSGNKVNYATPALEKGLDILELLAHQAEGLTKSQLARELNRTVSEIFRMLLCLERRGYIAQVAEDRYSLTLKLFQLVQEHPPTERLMVDAVPIMKRLADETQQSCHLGVLEGDKVVILAQVNSPTNLGFYVKLGSTVDLMESASGYVVLAHQKPEERERTLANWRERNSRRAPGDLARHLDRIRRTGFEKRASYLVKGVLNISFPVLDERGSAVGALTIPYIQYSGSDVAQKVVIEKLGGAAEALTAAIGGRAAAE